MRWWAASVLCRLDELFMFTPTRFFARFDAWILLLSNEIRLCCCRKTIASKFYGRLKFESTTKQRDGRRTGLQFEKKGGRTTWTIDLSFSVCTVRMLRPCQLFVHTTNRLAQQGWRRLYLWIRRGNNNQITMSAGSPAIYVSQCRKWAYAQAWWRSRLVSSSCKMRAVRSRSRRTVQCSRTGSSLMTWSRSPTLNLPRDSVSHKEMGPMEWQGNGGDRWR